MTGSTPDDATSVTGGPPDVAAVLAAKQAQLVDQLAELTRPHHNTGSISFGKRVGDGTAMAVDRLSAVQAHDTLTALLTEVQAARRRLAEGTYGTCEVCGDPIPAARLDARPWAIRCVADSR